MVRVSTRVAPEGKPLRELKLHKRELKVPKRVQNRSGKVPPIFSTPLKSFDSSNSGMKALFKLPANAKKVEDFKLFIDGELVSDICEEKNRYANQLLGSAMANTKTLKVWVRTTHDEMYAFLGVVI